MRSIPRLDPELKACETRMLGGTPRRPGAFAMTLTPSSRPALRRAASALLESLPALLLAAALLAPALAVLA